MIKYINKIGLFFVYIFVITSIGSVYNPQHSYAADITPDTHLTEADVKNATYAWVNGAKIKGTVGGYTFTFFNKDVAYYNGTSEGDGVFKGQNYGANCFAQVITERLTNGAYPKPGVGISDIDIRPVNTVGGECQNVGKPKEKINITISNTSASSILYKDLGNGTIGRVDDNNDGTKYIFTRSSNDPNSNLYLRSDSADGDGCTDRILVDPLTNTYKMYQLGKGTPPATPYLDALMINGLQCKLKTDDSWIISVNDKSLPLGVGEAGGPIGVGNAGSIGSSGDDLKLKCPTISSNPLNWFMCPMINMAVSGIQKLDQGINESLYIPISGTNSNFSNDGSFHKAWEAMRTIALSLLLVIALVMVISQAIGSGPFDAYTVKKVLPRIVVAVIAITLSWQLCKLLLGISNDLGQGIRSVIYTPFNGSLKAPVLGNGGKGAVGATMVGFFATGADFLVILSLAMTGLAAAFIALLVVAFRSILSIFLIITAPLAIILWILPNTQKAWKFWKENMEAVVLSFPIIIAFITLGRVFASISSNDGNTPSLVRDVITFFAYFGPYFILPKAFSLAGGAVGTISGMANDRGKGLFDRQKKFRGTQRAKKKAEGKNFSRYRDDNMIGRGMNTILGTVNNPTALGRGRAGIRAARQTGLAVGGQENLKNDRTFQAHGQDDNFLVALANEDMAIRKRDTADSEFKTGIRVNKDGTTKVLTTQERSQAAKTRDAHAKGINAARQVENRRQGSVRLAATNALAKTGYQFASGEEGYIELSDTIRGIVGNDEGAYAAAMDEAQFHLKSATRFDLGGINHGAGYSAKDGLDKAGLYQLANSKKQSISAMTATIPMGPLGHEAAVVYRELQAMKPNSTGAVADQIDKEIEALQSRGVGAYMSAPSGRAETDPATGGTRAATVQQRINFNPAADATHLTWSVAEQDRGWRTESRLENKGDVAQAAARTYQPPDPNNM